MVGKNISSHNVRFGQPHNKVDKFMFLGQLHKRIEKMGGGILEDVARKIMCDWIK